MKKNFLIRRSVAAACFSFMAVALTTMPGCSSMDDALNATSKGQLSVTQPVIENVSEESLTKAQAAPATATLPVEDGFGLLCTLTPEPAGQTRATTPMTVGSVYRMVAYQNGTVKGSQLFTAGSEATTAGISLAAGTYTFAFYSFNNGTDPGLPDPDGKVAVAEGTDLLWYSTTGTITAGATTSIAVTFSHKMSAIRVLANSWGVGPSISAVSATFSKSFAASFAPLTGIMVGTGSGTDKPITWSDGASKLRTADGPVIVYTGSLTSVTITFPVGSVTIGGVTNTTVKTVTFNKALASGVRYTLDVRFVKCTARLTYNGAWRAWMCHNLGSDYTADPFTPSYLINGAYYQWGASTPIIGNPVDAAGTDPPYTWSQLSNSGNYTENPWSTTSTFEIMNTLNGDAPIKKSADPCPTGYRVPTQKEYTGMVSVMHFTVASSNAALGSYRLIGTQSQPNSTYPTVPQNNFSYMVIYTDYTGTADKIAFMCPGYRYFSTGAMTNRGFADPYWTSSAISNTGYYASPFSGSSTADQKNQLSKGMAVRCIAE